jgi:MFS family permease
MTKYGSDRTRAIGGFIAFGLFWGAWGALLPAVQVSSRSTDGQLGAALLMIGLGALLSMRLTGRLIDSLGTAVLPVAMAVFAVVGVLPAFATSPVALGAVLLLLGAASGATDVAINAAGVRAEERSKRPVMNLAHAWFSASVVVASLGTAMLRAAGAGPKLILGTVFVPVAFVAMFVMASAVFGAREEFALVALRAHRGSLASGWDVRALRPPMPLIVFGCLGALAYLVENAWQSWGAVHMQTSLHASAAMSSTAPAVFASAAAAGRFAGNAMTRRFDPIWLLSAGALTAAAGTLLAATTRSPFIGLVGIGVAGLGTSVCAPTVISLAAAWAGPERKGVAVSIVTTVAYVGFLVGPAGVGLASSLTSLSTALSGVAVVAVLLAVLAPTAPRGRSPELSVEPETTRTRPSSNTADSDRRLNEPP